MKSILPFVRHTGLALLALFAAGTLLPSIASAQLVSSNDRVRVEVRVQTEQERKGNKGTTVDTVTQGKTLQITISGKAKSPETRTGKWMAYGRDAKDKALAVIESGDFAIDFATGAQKVESKKINTTYTPEHAPAGKGGGNYSKGSASKKVPAEGIKFAGYGVVIKDGDKIVGEFYDPAGVKAEAEKK